MNHALDTDFLGRLLLGRYRVVRRLAVGGMGVIYLARAEGAAGYVKPVVVKQLIPHVGQDDTMVRMFVREAHVLARLSHPNIVDVLDFAEEDGVYLLVLEYVHGYHLGHWYRYLKSEGRRFPAVPALRIVAQVLDALHYAHTHTDPDGAPAPIVHRDVSPSNVLVDVNGHVKLADFGIARVASLHTPYKTDTPSIKGKLSYMAPELLRAMDPTPRSDIFAAGTVLHEVLSGRNEFYRRDMTETMQRILEHRLTPLHALRDDVPDGIDEVIARATAKDPDDRYPDAGAFAEALRSLLQEEGAFSASDLRDLARRDFLGRLPEVRRLPSLDELERAWRQAPAHPDPPGSAASASSQPPTRVVHSRATTATPEPLSRTQRARISGPILALVVLLLAGASALAVFLTTRSHRTDQEAPRYIVVQSTAPAPSTDASAASPLPAPTYSGATTPSAHGPEEAGAASAIGDERPEAKSTPKPQRRPTPLQVRLTRAFSRRRPDIERCLQRYARAGSHRESVQIRFELDARGTIQGVSLVPSDAASSPLGRCILQVAHTTRFPRTGRALAFRIPVRLRME